MQANYITYYRKRFYMSAEQATLIFAPEGKVHINDDMWIPNSALCMVEKDKLRLIHLQPIQDEFYSGVTEEQLIFSDVSSHNLGLIQGNYLDLKQDLTDELRASLCDLLMAARDTMQIECIQRASKDPIYYGQLPGRDRATLMNFATFKDALSILDDEYIIVVPRACRAIVCYPKHLDEVIQLVDSGPDSTGFLYATAYFNPGMRGCGRFTFHYANR